MICYRDRSYCANQDECANEECYRRLTQKDRMRAARIGLPVAWMPFRESCGSDFVPIAVRIHAMLASTTPNTTDNAWPASCDTQPAG